MAGRDKLGRRTIRELVRVVFANRLTLLLCLLLGAGIGGLHSAIEERLYQGRIELVSAAPTPYSRYDFPDAIALRRLVLDPENLDSLLPPRAGQANSLIAAHRARWRTALRESLEMQRVVGESDSEGTVWQVLMLIPAASHDVALDRLSSYANRLQAVFVGSKGTAQGRTSQFTGTWNAAKEPLSKAAGRTPPPIPDETNAIAKLTVGLAENIDVVKGNIQSLEAQIRDIHSMTERRQQTLENLDNVPAGELLPKGVEEDFPEVAASRRRLDQLEQRRVTLATRVTTSHPSLRALDRSIADEKKQLSQGFAEVERVYRLEIAASGTEAKRLGERLEVEQAKLAELAKQVTADLVKESLAERQQQEAAIDAVAGAAPVVPRFPTASTGLLNSPVNLPAGNIVLPEPFVGTVPVRPKVARDIIVGSLLGITIGLCLLIARSLSDQRIYGVMDMEQLDLEVFGSIPQLRNVPPVQVGAKV